MEPKNKDDERMAVPHANASGGDIIENQHDENRMRDIHVGKRGSDAADEEQLDKLRKTSRSEQETPHASSSSDPLVALEYPASGETQDRPGSELVHKSGHVENFRVGCIPRDSRVVTSEKCWIGIDEKMLEISRELN